jgi:hypothetical protein
MEMETLSRGRAPSVNMKAAAPSHDFSLDSPSGSPRMGTMQSVLPSLAAEMQQAGRWNSPTRSGFASRELDSPVNQVFTRLSIGGKNDSVDGTNSQAVGSGGGGEGGRGENTFSKDHSLEGSDNETMTTATEDDDVAGGGEGVGAFDRPLSVANVGADRATMEVHSEYRSRCCATS